MDKIKIQKVIIKYLKDQLEIQKEVMEEIINGEV